VQVARGVLEALQSAGYNNVVNLPFVSGEVFSRTRPYLDPAERLGALQAELAGPELRGVEIEVKGPEAAGLVKAIAVALLKGRLGQRLAVPVNYVNTPGLAAEQHLHVTQARGLETADYTSLISCRVSWSGGTTPGGRHALRRHGEPDGAVGRVSDGRAATGAGAGPV
jgi:D-3-phosphoglycerate dehydrogenase / 2-oxoglutarate reductase